MRKAQCIIEIYEWKIHVYIRHSRGKTSSGITKYIWKEKKNINSWTWWQMIFGPSLFHPLDYYLFMLAFSRIINSESRSYNKKIRSLKKKKKKSGPSKCFAWQRNGQIVKVRIFQTYHNQALVILSLKFRWECAKDSHSCQTLIIY